MVLRSASFYMAPLLYLGTGDQSASVIILKTCKCHHPLPKFLKAFACRPAMILYDSRNGLRTTLVVV